jgi:hypothetical protein
VVDVDASNAVLSNDVLSYVWAVQALDISTGNPITGACVCVCSLPCVGGGDSEGHVAVPPHHHAGTYCLSSWMSTPLTGTRRSTGAPMNFGFTLLATGTAAQADQRCRYTLTVTDPEGVSVFAV